MLTDLLSINYNIDSTRGLNKAIKTALIRSAATLPAGKSRDRVPGGLLNVPGAINSLRNGGFLPPSASASSFPVYVAVALVGVVVGMALACVLGFFVRTLWHRRQAGRRQVDEKHNLLTIAQREASSASLKSYSVHSEAGDAPPKLDIWKDVSRLAKQSLAGREPSVVHPQRAPPPPERMTTPPSPAAPPCERTTPPSAEAPLPISRHSPPLREVGMTSSFLWGPRITGLRSHTIDVPPSEGSFTSSLC